MLLMLLRDIVEIRNSCVMQYDIEIYSCDDYFLGYEAQLYFDEKVYNFEPKICGRYAKLVVRLEKNAKQLGRI